MKQAAQVREGGNLIWGIAAGPTLARDLFARFRTSRLFALVGQCRRSQPHRQHSAPFPA